MPCHQLAQLASIGSAGGSQSAGLAVIRVLPLSVVSGSDPAPRDSVQGGESSAHRRTEGALLSSPRAARPRGPWGTRAGPYLVPCV